MCVGISLADHQSLPFLLIILLIILKRFSHFYSSHLFFFSPKVVSPRTATFNIPHFHTLSFRFPSSLAAGFPDGRLLAVQDNILFWVFSLFFFFLEGGEGEVMSSGF